MNISQYVSDTPPPPSHPLTTLDSFYIQSISARLISTPSTLHQPLLRPQWTFQWETRREMNDLYRDQTLGISVRIELLQCLALGFRSFRFILLDLTCWNNATAVAATYNYFCHDWSTIYQSSWISTITNLKVILRLLKLLLNTDKSYLLKLELNKFSDS